MTTEAATTPVSRAAAVPLNDEEDAIVISLGISNPTNPNSVGLIVPPNQQYLHVPEGFNGTITWNLDGDDTTNAFYDNPPITVSGDCLMPELTTQTSKSITMNWANDSLATQGMSFFYTLRVFVVIDNMDIPVRHDPTVHNDPPTP